MYAYWYEDGNVMSYEGAWEDFKECKDSNNCYLCGSFKYMTNEWLKSEMINGINSICNVFAEDVPSDIRAMHLLLVKE